MRVASVEDDVGHAQRVATLLGRMGHECETFARARELIAALRNSNFDLLLMDWQLPDMNGVDLTKWVRKELGNRLPILFVSNRVLMEDQITALCAGADDYLSKPLNDALFVARVNALLRRTTPRFNRIIQVGPYELDPGSCTITLDGVLLEVTPREFDLAFYLFSNPDRLVSAEVLEKAVWGRPLGTDSRTVTTHLSRLRIKLGLTPKNGVRLSSVYGRGYRLGTLDELRGTPYAFKVAGSNPN